MELINKTVLVGLILFMSGCVATKQLYNEASLSYQETAIFSDPVLDQNKAMDVLFLVSTGYIQTRNENQLSIYINCVSNKPRSVNILSGELIIAGEVKSVAETSEVDCVRNVPYSYTSENGYQYGVGYFHFFGTELTEYIKKPDIVLRFEVEIESNRHTVTLPIKSKRVWVWPT